MKYNEFLKQKAISDPSTGISDIPPLHEALFPFQHDIVSWALKRGRSAIFAGTGLGKSLMELSWGDTIHRATGENVLLLTPLSVAAQMTREADKFGIVAKHCRTQNEVQPGITITNYHKLNHFDVSAFGAVVLDESSILKNLDGKTRTRLIGQFQQTPFRLAATATPAPNDFMELGNHAEFLGVLSYAEMLATFFVHDGGDTQSWRLKRHAENDFWRWMCSWSVMLRHPRDLGYEDARYNLPPLEYHQHSVAADYTQANAAGLLFPLEARTLQERLRAKRASIVDRVAAATQLIPTENPCVIWCHLNDESDMLAKAMPEAVEVRGSDSEDEKERKLDDFSSGRSRILITKTSIAGFGMNWQHCADTIFVGLNDSFEQVYQAIRRFWRFGQNKPVHVHFIASELEGAVVANLKRKEEQADTMSEAMVRHMADLTSTELHGSVRQKIAYTANKKMEIPEWLQAA